MKKRAMTLLLGLLLLAPCASVARAADERVRVLLEEALRVYGERQYVRALDLFKQVERLDPANATAKEYIGLSEQRIMEWDKQDAAPEKPLNPTWDSLTKDRRSAAPETVTNAADIVAARKSLVDRMRNRSTNTSNIVQIQENRKGFEITLFHDQLFLPGLQTLRDESLPILENVAQLLREKGDREITVKSVSHENSNDPFLLYPDQNSAISDPSLPRLKGSTGSLLFQDIESTRAFILFTHLAQRSIRPNEVAKQ